ncbi:soluble interferon-gamma receptor-like protein [Raccoonpox virus]|uniref:Interferon-gamma receptor-like protein n=1 Tax=Raccoon poxvirus TaxID=10256 RepID=A0A0G3G094_RACVI|nr:Interferon-gamma receptor-like protein [Raccoonpox virus]AKJ93814.1 Interferon-gamma receptor-like protein [Raccoonpox virus]AOP31447.1 soluble interferon-gamma receptor-like protein [Raccoonpox virus]
MKSISLTVLFISVIDAAITSYKFESVNFDSKIQWTGDGLYNISLKNYGFDKWETMYTDVSEGTYDVSGYPKNDFVSFWIKFEQGDYKVEEYHTGLCIDVKIGSPTVRLTEFNDHINLFIAHPYTTRSGKKIPIYKRSDMCDIYMLYTAKFKFGDGEPITYDIDDYDCTSTGCSLDFTTTEKICVSVQGATDDKLLEKETPWSPEVCITPKKNVFTCDIRSKDDVQNFKNKMSRVIKRKFNKQTQTYMNKYLESTSSDVATILSMLE